MASINELQLAKKLIKFPTVTPIDAGIMKFLEKKLKTLGFKTKILEFKEKDSKPCLLYTSPSPRDGLLSRMPSSA